ncbi:hypothetical protein G9A89_023174 [Geosiphon pyriformis]|nr:hypothetical protein G9A89_023174 [Geosiphon pyriformis]
MAPTEKLTKENWKQWTEQLLISYCYYQLSQKLNIQELYIDKSKRIFNQDMIQQIEKFIGKKTNSTPHVKTMYQLHNIFQNYSEILLHSDMETITINQWGRINNTQVKNVKNRVKQTILEKEAELSSFFAAGTFVDDTIWIGSSQNATQHILDVVGEFFQINNVSINNDKTVVILINSRVGNPSLFINGSPISITKKSELHHNTIHNSSFYGLKPFFQVQSESKVASLNPVHLLSFPIHIRVSAFNNFLAGMVHVLLDCNLSLGGFLATPFQFHSGVPMSAVLSKSKFLRFFPFLWQHSIVFINQLRDHYGAFKFSVVFLNSMSFSSAPLSVLHGVGFLNILESSNFMSVCDHLSQAGTSSLSVYTDRSLSNLSTASYKAGAATYFEDIGLGLEINVLGLMLSMLVELQAIVLALEFVFSSSFVQLFSDSQSALDTCKSELRLACSDFCNQCWVKCYYIINVIHSKNLRVSWHKVKDHSGISENECTDALIGAASLSDWYLLSCLDEHFLIANSSIVFGNSRHFCHSSLVWHPNLNMATSFTSKLSANACTYFIKALYHWLLVAVQKCLYNRLYPSVLCLYCGKVEVSDHVFSCKIDESAWHHLLESHVNSWKVVSGLFHSSLDILQLLSSCISDFSVFTALHKGFVFNGWFCKAVSVFHDFKVASLEIVKFVHSFGLHYAYIEKNELIPIDGSAVISIPGLVSRFSAGVVKLLGITNAVGVCFGFHKSCLFFSGVSDPISVHIAV